MGKSFDPDKHGMVMCPECKGNGKLPKGPEGRESVPNVEALALSRKSRTLLNSIQGS